MGACACPLLAAELVAVSNGTGGGLDADAASNLLLGRTSSLPGGRHVALVISAGSAGEAAVEAFTGRDVPRLLRGWKRLVFSGTAAMPAVAPDDEAAIALVARTPDAVVLLRTPPPVAARPGLTVVRVAGVDEAGHPTSP